jgi:membrane-associated phospholipid phosphatase
MEIRSRDSLAQLREMTAVTTGAVVAIVASIFWFDAQLTLAISGLLKRIGLYSATSSLPDILLRLTILVSVGSWIGYALVKNRPAAWRVGPTLKMLGTSVPISYVVKDLLQRLFGRVCAPSWLLHPTMAQFHWIKGCSVCSCFPSGHMAVFTVIVLVVCRWQTQGLARAIAALMLTLLAVALLLTRYHFLSDIMAGALTGYLVERSVSLVLRSPKTC